MQYYVGIENVPYRHWQIELLIESFKLRNIENQLIVGVKECFPEKSVFDTRNITEHKNKIYFEEEYPSLFGMIAAQERGILKQPFTYIHSDMLLIQESIFKSDKNIVFHQRHYPDKKLEDTLKMFPSKTPRIELGGVIVFQDVPISYFYDAWEKAKDMTNLVPDAVRGGLIMSYLDHFDKVTIEPSHFESTLWQDEIKKESFLHYKHGLPPSFHKKHYKWSELFLCDDYPFETLLKHNPNQNTNHMQNVIKSYLRIS